MGDVKEFVINDRRGQRKDPREEVTAITLADNPEPEADKSSWKEVGYFAIPVQTRFGLLMMGKVAGIRSDGRAFCANYLIAPVWTDTFSWQPLARTRLDTYLGCGCSATAPCATHNLYLASWAKADDARAERAAMEPVPQAIEVILRAEMAEQQSRIVVPGGKPTGR
jgi:hypothetical protein